VDNNQPALLICIYTCDAYQRLHAEFHESRIGKYLKSFGDTRCIYVRADPTLSKSKMGTDCLTLTVDTVEAYSNLCLKTYKMIQYCTNHLSFDFLMKIDVTSGVEAMNLNPEVVNRVSDQQKMIDHLEEVKNSIGMRTFDHYAGWKKIKANQTGVERWARLKGLEIDYEKLLGGEILLPYFSGKCYTVSRRFARFISEHGEGVALAHTQCLPGSEDMMIGRLYGRFKTCPE